MHRMDVEKKCEFHKNIISYIVKFQETTFHKK